jgi:ribosomal-protein-alanine N-acetyltransferase
MQNKYIELVPADTSLAEQVANYYKRNRKFLADYEPRRDEQFFSLEYQQEVLKKEMDDFQQKSAFRFYIKPTDQSHKIIGIIGLNNVVWGAFCSAFLGYKLDERFINKGYMSMAVDMLVRYAFDVLHLHRIEANVMPKNTASLRVLEKNLFINEGISKYYLNINGTWEDHIHMVRINYDMH